MIISNHNNLNIKKADWEIDFYSRPITEANGKKRWEGTFKNGKLNGLYMEWYMDGQKMIEVTYKNGKEDGLVSSWYSNGQKKDIQIYKDDNLVKLIGRWNEDGSIRE